jgi:histidine ammonia-lyase
MTPTILLTGAGVMIDDVVRVARADAPVALAPAARARVEARAVVERLRNPTPRSTASIQRWGQYRQGDRPGRPRRLPERAVQARAVGVGPRFATDIVRAILFARASCVAVGGFGISPACSMR